MTQTRNYWNITMNEILGENGVSVNGKTLAKISDQVEGAASVSVDYAAPTGDRSVEYTYDVITCPSCNGESWRTTIQGCSMCRGDQTIKIAREIS